MSRLTTSPLRPSSPAAEPPLRILAVDDNDAIRYALTRYLREDGYEVIEARSGAEALVLARSNPALITLDVNLGDMDGVEVCRKLKADPETKDIPVLHISASAVESEDRVRGLEGGAAGYLAEPIMQEELLATVKALLRMRQAQREAEKAKHELKEINKNLEIHVKERTAELERRNLEIQALSSRLLQAQDDERRRISRELHDSTGQLLVALGLNLDRMNSEFAHSDPEAVKVIADTNSIVDEMSRQLRTMSYLLHPPLLDEAGLISAVKWFVDGFAKRSSVEVILELPADLGRLPQDLETTIFRLIQESLTNVHRHSGSKSAMVRLSQEGPEMRLEIVDEGKGLPSSALTNGYLPGAGVGIPGMKERVRRFGGTLKIASSPSGTSVRAVLPIAPQSVQQTA
jgi:signal transduction histidine kinase